MGQALPSRATTIAATGAALVAFAGNSLLCRLALGQKLIDAGSFTLVRIVSGAVVLAAIVSMRQGEGKRWSGSWTSGAALFGYALAFSLAYLDLPAGVGALVLFGSVQVTMIAWGLVRGERPGMRQWLGLVAAMGGLIYLMVDRHTSAPPLASALLMAVAGFSWGVYSLRGRGAEDPIGATAGNFALAAPLAIVAWLTMAASLHFTTAGIMLALVSGAVTSGLGYVIWYLALPGLSATRAALVQLAVPILTALAAVGLLGEPLTLRLAVASALVLGGIALAVFSRRRK